MRNYLSWFLKGASHKLTMQIGARFGQHFPMHFVCGYPRSGTTWFSELLADYLNLPRPRHYYLPLAFSCVVHTHVPASHRLDDCFYVIRDGRDSLVSAYFMVLKELKENDGFVYREVFNKLFSNDFEDHKKNILKYIDYQFSRRKNHWGYHVSGWIKKASSESSNITVIKYEDLVDNPYNTFMYALQSKYGEVESEYVSAAVERQSFDRQKRRTKDQHRTFMRKGEAGDWRNWFTSESAKKFDDYSGDVLILAGYEKDRNWVNQEQNDNWN